MKIQKCYDAILPVADVNAQLKIPCRYGDDIEITSWISEWENKSLKVSHIIFNAGLFSVDEY